MDNWEWEEESIEAMERFPWMINSIIWDETDMYNVIEKGKAKENLWADQSNSKSFENSDLLTTASHKIKVIKQK